MRKILIILAFMTLSALSTMAQIDLHSHAITKGYFDYIKANGAEMDEGFPIPAPHCPPSRQSVQALRQ